MRDHWILFTRLFRSLFFKQSSISKIFLFNNRSEIFVPMTNRMSCLKNSICNRTYSVTLNCTRKQNIQGKDNLKKKLKLNLLINYEEGVCCAWKVKQTWNFSLLKNYLLNHKRISAIFHSISMPWEVMNFNKLSAPGVLLKKILIFTEIIFFKS